MIMVFKFIDSYFAVISICIGFRLIFKYEVEILFFSLLIFILNLKM